MAKTIATVNSQFIIKVFAVIQSYGTNFCQTVRATKHTTTSAAATTLATAGATTYSTKIE